MTSVTEIEELIEKIDGTPYGPEERELIRQALTLCAELDNPDLEYRLRIRQTSSSFMAGDAETMLVSFPWCISWHDVDPARFPHQVDGQDLLWQFKWMSDLLTINPRFSLSQVNEICDDMERRYTAAGIGLSGVWQAKFSTAARSGHHDQAKLFRQRRDEVPVDDYSHCPACVRSEDAAWFFEIGQPETALKVFDEIIEGGFTCGEEPERAQGQALLGLLRAGRFDDAANHHRQALRMAKASADPLPLILAHLPFLAITGNLASALALLEEYLPMWASHAINLALRHRAATCFGIVLDLMTSSGHGDIPIRGSDHPALEGLLGPREQPLTAAQLARRCWRVADELADDFDERNGTDRFARLNQAARDLLDEHYDLPLGDPIPLELHSPAPPPRNAAGHFALGQLKKYLTNDRKGAWESFQLALQLGDEELTVEVLAEICSLAQDVSPDQAGEWGEIYLAALEKLGRGPEAAFLKAFGLGTNPDGPTDFAPYDSDPDERVRHRVLTRQLELAHRTNDRARIEQLYPQVVSATHPDLAYSVAKTKIDRAYTLIASDPEQVIASSTDFENLPWPWMVFLHSNLMASIHRMADRPAEGTPWATKALEIATRYGVRPLIARSADLLADLLANQGQLPQAVNTQRIAVRQDQLSGSVEEANYRMKLGHLLIAVNRGSEAADEFEAVAKLEKARGEGPGELTVDYALAAQAVQAEDPQRAYNAFRQAFEHATLANNSEMLIKVAITFGHFLRVYEEPSCVDVLQQVLPHLSNAPELAWEVNHELGQARCAFGDEGGLEDLNRALALTQRSEDQRPLASVLASIGRFSIGFNKLDLGLQALDRSSTLSANLNDSFSAAMTELDATKALIDAGRIDEAETVLARARARLADDPQLLDRVTSDFVDFFIQAGGDEAAGRLRSQIIGPELI